MCSYILTFNALIFRYVALALWKSSSIHCEPSIKWRSAETQKKLCKDMKQNGRRKVLKIPIHAESTCSTLLKNKFFSTSAFTSALWWVLMRMNNFLFTSPCAHVYEKMKQSNCEGLILLDFWFNLDSFLLYAHFP